MYKSAIVYVRKQLDLGESEPNHDGALQVRYPLWYLLRRDDTADIRSE
jgi:hypothetical protein